MQQMDDLAEGASCSVNDPSRSNLQLRPSRCRGSCGLPASHSRPVQGSCATTRGSFVLAEAGRPWGEGLRMVAMTSQPSVRKRAAMARDLLLQGALTNAVIAHRVTCSQADRIAAGAYLAAQAHSQGCQSGSRSPPAYVAAGGFPGRCFWCLPWSGLLPMEEITICGST